MSEEGLNPAPGSKGQIDNRSYWYHAHPKPSEWQELMEKSVGKIICVNNQHYWVVSTAMTLSDHEPFLLDEKSHKWLVYKVSPKDAANIMAQNLKD